MNGIEDQCLMEVTYGTTAINDIIKGEIEDEWFEPLKETIRKYDKDLDDELLALTISNIMLNTDQEVFTIQSAIVKLAIKLKGYTGIKAVEIASDLLNLCEGELYNIIYINNIPYVEPNFVVDKETREFLENRQFLLPMLVKPLKWTNNFDGGWILHRKCAIHGRINHHSKPQALDVLNILQEIAWELDPDMLNYEEESNKPLDSKEKREQFLKLKQTSRSAYEEMVDWGNKFYFVWRFDKRGRMYSQGYQINLQSTSYKKSLLNFHKKELITGTL